MLSTREVAGNAHGLENAMFKAMAALALIVVSGAALAQGSQPYALMEERAVKALSEEQIADLKAGRGMGLALSAELNGYPGPAHVLEHGNALGLTVEQRQNSTALFAAMKAEAVPIGERWIKLEKRLDQLFATGQITTSNLRAITEEIGTTQARLREAHLKYHLAMMAILNVEQIEKYRSLRGYGSSPKHPHRPH
jgi:Spy/CpxP family protein refolding chaperone